MPTYEYACKSCGEHLEVVQSFKDDELTTCPSCGGPLRKVFGSIGIAFKGSGFYKTDSRSSSSSSKAASTKETKDSSEKPSSTDGSSSPGAGKTSTSTSTESGSGSAKSTSSQAAAS